MLHMSTLYHWMGVPMSYFGLVLIFFVIVVPVILLCVLLFYLVVKAASGGSRAARPGNAEQTRLIQEIHQGLVRMEQRIEALETIVLEAEERRESR